MKSHEESRTTHQVNAKMKKMPCVVHRNNVSLLPIKFERRRSLSHTLPGGVTTETIWRWQLSHINRRENCVGAIQLCTMVLRASINVVLIICIGAIAIGQFLPPPPERFGSQRQQPPRRPLPPLADRPLPPIADVTSRYHKSSLYLRNSFKL